MTPRTAEVADSLPTGCFPEQRFNRNWGQKRPGRCIRATALQAVVLMVLCLQDQRLML